MIRVTNERSASCLGGSAGPALCLEGYCDTDDFDDLPTVNIATGSNFIDADNGNVYMFNEKTGAYKAVGNLNGEIV